MRRATWLVAVVLLALAPVGVRADVAVQGGVGAAYLASGPMGELTIVNAMGMPFFARSWNGMVVGEGVVLNNNFTIPVMNFGPAPDGHYLDLQVGPVLLKLGSEKDWNWE